MKKKLPDWVKEAILKDVEYITNSLIELERYDISANETPIPKSRKKRTEAIN